MGFLSGKKPAPRPSGGNRERESFNSHVDGIRSEREGAKPSNGGAETKIVHNNDGSHTVHHADGEQTDHTHIGHMLMTLHSKHAEGDGGHMHVHPEGSATTHHVGMDGNVEGPHEHESAAAAAEHLGKMTGDGPENETSSVQVPDYDNDGM